MHSTGIDGHIVDGLFSNKRGHTTRPDKTYPRLIQLILLHLQEATTQASEKRINAGYLLLPSPLHIAVEALTVPSEAHTRAFPLVAGRLLLSKWLKVWPRNAFIDQVEEPDKLIDESAIIEEIGNCRTLVEYGDIWEIKQDPKKLFIGHYMAMRGVLLYRFKAPIAIQFLEHNFSTFGIKADPETTDNPKADSPAVQFRLSDRYLKLPAPSDFMNEILGVPVALRGMENVFFNGLKPSVSAGLAVQLAGGPGTGKTTFALALAAALAPIGTQCFYFSFEEQEGDLVSKLRQQSQPRLSRLSFHSANESEWFSAFPIESTSLEFIENQIIAPLRRRILEAKSDWQTLHKQNAIIPPLPFYVVLDSISALSLLSKTEADAGTRSIRQRLAAFVNLCREMRVLVVMITSEDRSSWGELDYLVDMAIELRVDAANEHGTKPTRLFSLNKSRQQISRHGTHIFHLSGDSGFRIAPQLSSQMDAQQNFRELLWDKQSFLEVLNVRGIDSGRYKYVEFMDLHARSKILLQGKGSSGKAGLALKIALAPRFFRDDGYVPAQSFPRVLVLSFLYPPLYYDGLQKKLLSVMQRETSVTRLRKFDGQVAERYIKGIPPVTVIHLTPGVLHAEDLHSKMVRHLDEGRLSGLPYTAVIIDGLHNLALQFPGATESSHLFPIIYGTLSRANVMTITTFTTLAISSSERKGTSDSMEESIFRLRVHLPLLHTFVQASDYVFEVFRNDNPNRRAVTTEDEGATYLINIQSTISRDPPVTYLGWRRQDLEFCDPGRMYDKTQADLPID